MALKSIRIEFPNARGEKLAAALELPEGEPIAYGLFAHCFTCSKEIAAASRISIGLRGRGIAVLRFDFTGLGGSEGDFANTNFSSNVEDLLAAADYLRERYAAPQLLVGHSLGGAAVLAAAPRIPESRVVATVAAPSTTAQIRGLLADRSSGQIERDGEAEVVLAGRTFRIRQQLLDDLEAQDVLHTLGDLDKALVVFHSPDDTVVGIDHGLALFDAAAQPKSFISLPGADHLLSDRADSEFVAATLATWVGRHLVPAGEEEAALPHGTVEVREAGPGKFTQRIRMGRHTILADEPRGVGDDLGANPYDLLLASLGACTSMTLRMYADHKKLPVREIAVRLQHAKIHAEDCRDCETKTGKVDRIERVLTIDGDLTPEQRERLREIADRCPVHRTLHAEKEILTTLAD